MVKNYFLLFFFLILTKISAQEMSMVFKNYDTQDGLCDNHINSIVEDNRGMIWIATREGLSRYDGAQFKNFYASKSTKNSLKNNFTSNLLPYDNNHILLLNDGKPVLINCENNKIEPIKKLKKYKFINISILKTNQYLLNTQNEVFIVNEHFDSIQTIKTPLLKSPFQVKWMGNDEYLLCDYTSFCIFNIKKQTYTPVSFAFQKTIQSQAPYHLIQFIDTKLKRFYISDYWTGLYVYDFQGNLLNHYSTNNKKNTISSNTIIFTLLAKDGNLWLATDNGINIINLKTNRIKQLFNSENDKLSIASNVELVVLEDKNNSIWIGTDQGISVYKNQSKSMVKKIEFNAQKKITQSVSSIAFDNQQLYVGCYLSDTYKINTTTLKIEKLNDTPKAWSVQNYDGRIIITGAGTSITEYNSQNHTYKKLDFLKPFFPKTDIVVLCYKHSNGDYWYSGNAGGGLVRVESKTHQIHHYKSVVNGKHKFYSSYYPNVAEDTNGDLWFGVNRSSTVLHWIKATDSFEEFQYSYFSKDSSLNLGGISNLVLDKAHNLWIGYEGNGLVNYNTKTKVSKLYTTENGLNSNYLYSLQFDNNGRLWMLTAKGVSCFVPQQNKMLQLDIWDGFIENPTNYSLLKMNVNQNTMWLGANNCVYYFNPDDIIKNKSLKGTIYIDNIKINNKDYIDSSNAVTQFKPDENTIQFDIVAVDIENGKNIEYSYKLDGFDQQWVTIGSNRSVLFPKLKSGSYSFNARARYHGSNEWFYLKTTFQFSVATIWYQTWWFLALLLLGFAFIIWYIVWFNFKKKLEKQKAVEEERNRIAADMHDDLGSGLTKITYLSQMAMQKIDNTEYLSNIKTTSRDLVESMSEIIWAMKEENNRWDELLSYLKLYAQEYGQKHNLNVTFIFPEEDMNFEIIGEVRRHIFLCVKECLHNIVKHAKAENITLTIEKKDKLYFTIKDDGIGINLSSEIRVGGNGLKNLKIRMEKIHGELNITNDKGTIVLFKIPY